MRREHADLLRCPGCGGSLSVEGDSAADGHVVAGRLLCRRCRGSYPICEGVPRFVPSSNYAHGFGVQWKRHAWTQYDACTGRPLSEKRFFDETGWPRTLVGERILEVGSGGGRFSVHAAGTGAVVASLDYSEAVDANFAINRHIQNLLIIQADVYRMPFATAFFDRASCFGVLQHTPDPHGAFLSIVPKVRAGGKVVADIYVDSLLKHWLSTKYWVRPVTKRMQPERLHRLTSAWVDLMWPIASLVRRVPRVGPQLNWRLLVPDYSREGLRGADLKRWALLDAFDMLSPTYDKPATEGAFRQWFLQASLVDVDVRRGYNGVQGRGAIPLGVG